MCWSRPCRMNRGTARLWTGMTLPCENPLLCNISDPLTGGNVGAYLRAAGKRAEVTTCTALKLKPASFAQLDIIDLVSTVFYCFIFLLTSLFRQTTTFLYPACSDHPHMPPAQATPIPASSSIFAQMSRGVRPHRLWCSRVMRPSRYEWPKDGFQT